MQTYPELRVDLLGRLIDMFPQIKSTEVYRATLWIIGEYSESADDIELSCQAVRDCLGDPTFKELEEEEV
jgi:coatomer subunit beta